MTQISDTDPTLRFESGSFRFQVIAHLTLALLCHNSMACLLLENLHVPRTCVMGSSKTNTLSIDSVFATRFYPEMHHPGKCTIRARACKHKNS